MRKLSVVVTAAVAIALFVAPASAELGTNTPPNDDATLKMQRVMEATVPSGNPSGIFDIPLPGPNQKYLPAGRVPREKYGVVSSFMPNGLQEQDLRALVYPDTFTPEHT